MRGIRTTMIVTHDWYPESSDFPTEADLLEAAQHDAGIYQNDPGLFVTDCLEDSRIEVSIALVEGEAPEWTS